MEGVLNLFDLSLIYLFNTLYLCFLTNNIFVMLEQLYIFIFLLLYSFNLFEFYLKLQVLLNIQQFKIALPSIEFFFIGMLGQVG